MWRYDGYESRLWSRELGGEHTRPNNPFQTSGSDGGQGTGSLRAFATVWECGGCRGAFITIDVLGIPLKFTRELRESLATKGFSPQAVLVNATHTHTSPTFVSMARICRDCPEFYDEALRAALKAVDRAIEDLSSAALEVCNSSCPISLNRRQIGRLCDINDIGAPSGEVDDRLTVLRLKRSRGDILLVHYAAHPLTVWADPFVISADYPGRLVDAVERMCPGSRCQFLQGTCGNVNLKIHGDDKTSDIVADMLAHRVMHSLENPRSIAVDSVKCTLGEVSLPLDRAGTLEDRSAIHEAFSSVYSEEAWSAWLAEVQVPDGSAETQSCSQVEIQGVKLGEFSIIALPGEPFNEIGRRIRELGPIRCLDTPTPEIAATCLLQSHFRKVVMKRILPIGFTTTHSSIRQ